jgi:hypothetical protein
MQTNTKDAMPMAGISRRRFLAGSTAIGASLLLARVTRAASLAGVEGSPLKEYDIATDGISLHVTDQGEGPAVLFCHGFPDTSYTWRRQMTAIASVRETVQLYLDGKIDQWFSLQGRSGVAFILNVTDRAAAHDMLEKLPLGQAHLMSFELIPLAPLNPRRQLQGMSTNPP